jgi:hypothetical protein
MPDKRKVVRQKDGSFLVELQPGGKKVRTVAEPDDFDAHQFEVLAGGLELPRTARGGVRDLAPEPERPEPDRGPTYDIGAGERVDPAPSKPMPTLAETQERARYVDGAPPAMDTIYVSPEERERRRRIEAAAIKGARVRHGADVHFYDPEKPVSL